MKRDLREAELSNEEGEKVGLKTHALFIGPFFSNRTNEEFVALTDEVN